MYEVFLRGHMTERCSWPTPKFNFPPKKSPGPIAWLSLRTAFISRDVNNQEMFDKAYRGDCETLSMSMSWWEFSERAVLCLSAPGQCNAEALSPRRSNYNYDLLPLTPNNKKVTNILIYIIRTRPLHAQGGGSLCILLTSSSQDWK